MNLLRVKSRSLHREALAPHARRDLSGVTKPILLATTLKLPVPTTEQAERCAEGAAPSSQTRSRIGFDAVAE